MKNLFTAVLFFAKITIASGQLHRDSINIIIQNEVASKRSKSIIVGIIDANGRQIISAGKLSDKNTKQPDGNTIYEIGSVTKVFTSLLLADMSLKGQLNLNDPISKFLAPYLKTPLRNGKEITLLNLATHTSGFPRMPDNLNPKNSDNPFADYTINQLQQYISSFQLTRDIGSQYQYSNTAYGLLGNILSSVAGKDFETLVKQEICIPLKMNSTIISLTPALKRNMATGHSEYGTSVGNWDLPTLAGGGALRSNVNDLLTFAGASLGLTETDLLPAMALSHIAQAKKDGNEGFVTMGWTLVNENGRELLWKDGATGGFRSFLALDKKRKAGVVILSNSFNDIKDIGFHILDSTFAVKPYQYKWKVLDTVNSTIKIKGVDSAIELYHRIKLSKQAEFIFDENQLNYIGNDLRQAKKMNDAIKIFQLNAATYPKSVLAYESLGETYKRNGNKKLAIENFEKLIELDPQNAHGLWMLKKLKF